MKFLNIFKFKTTNDPQLAPPTAGLAAQIQAATNIAMDEASRQEMRAHLSEYTKMRPLRVAPNAPHERISSTWGATYLRRHSMSAVAAVLIVMVSAGTVAAAEGALPGDILYPVKVHVTEEVRVALAPTPKARAAIAVLRAERRLEEAATLALAGKLNDGARAELGANLDEHLKSAGDIQVQLASENDPVEASDVEKNIGAIAIAREDILGGGGLGGGAVVAMRAEVASDMFSAMSLPAREKPVAKTKKQRDTSDTLTKGRRTAAKARIEATKKFLNHVPPHVGTTTEVTARKQLKAATEAFSSGEVDAARGDKEEASANFNSALEAATEIQALISVSDDASDAPKDEGRKASGSDSIKPDLEL